jgi:NitT/TauT family transport system permease protein
MIQSRHSTSFSGTALLAGASLLLTVIGLTSLIFTPDLGVVEMPRVAIAVSLMAIMGVRIMLGFQQNRIGDVAIGIVTAISALLLIGVAHHHRGQAAPGFWALVAAIWLSAWLLASRLSAWRGLGKTAARVVNLAIPLVFGLTLLALWEPLAPACRRCCCLPPPPSGCALPGPCPSSGPISSRPF